MADQDCITELKQCRHCDEWFPATEEHFHRIGKYLRSYCNSCNTIIQRDWRNNNREQAQKNWRAAHQRKKERDAIGLKTSAAKRSRKHYLQHRDEKREQSRSGMQRWRTSHREIHRLRESNRRARIKGLPFKFSVEDWDRALTYFEHRCAYCGRDTDMWTTMAVDHFVPLNSNDCPGTIVQNIVPACHSLKGVPDGIVGCNQSKGASDPIQWIPATFGKRKGNQILKHIQSYFEWVVSQ